MKYEKSYGAVIYKKEGDRLLFLIEQMQYGHISLPKGHIEEGETPLECAKREIKEETNLEVLLDSSFTHTITYSPAKDVSKNVTFFLATPLTDKIKPQLEEVKEIKYLPYG